MKLYHSPTSPFVRKVMACAIMRSPSLGPQRPRMMSITTMRPCSYSRTLAPTV